MINTIASYVVKAIQTNTLMYNLNTTDTSDNSTYPAAHSHVAVQIVPTAPSLASNKYT